MVKDVIKVGQKVRFDPFRGIGGLGFPGLPGKVDGRVTFVHPTHRWFRVEYMLGDTKAYTCFNFNHLTSTGNYRTVFIVKEK